MTIAIAQRKGMEQRAPGRWRTARTCPQIWRTCASILVLRTLARCVRAGRQLVFSLGHRGSSRGFGKQGLGEDHSNDPHGVCRRCDRRALARARWTSPPWCTRRRSRRTPSGCCQVCDLHPFGWSDRPFNDEWPATAPDPLVRPMTGGGPASKRQEPGERQSASRCVGMGWSC